MNQMGSRNLIFVILAVTLVGVAAYYFMTRLGYGDPAPEFDLPDITGTRHTLSDYKGEMVVLYFWATWCPICVAETPIVQKVNDEFSKKNVNVVSILLDKPHGDEALRVFKQRIPITFPVLIDEKGAVADAYGIYAVPETFVIGGDGIILKRISGPVDFDEIKQIWGEYADHKSSAGK